MESKISQSNNKIGNNSKEKYVLDQCRQCNETDQSNITLSTRMKPVS